MTHGGAVAGEVRVPASRATVQGEGYALVLADSFEWMDGCGEASVHAIVTDPPYPEYFQLAVRAVPELARLGAGGAQSAHRRASDHVEAASSAGRRSISAHSSSRSSRRPAQPGTGSMTPEAAPRAWT